MAEMSVDPFVLGYQTNSGTSHRAWSMPVNPSIAFGDLQVQRLQPKWQGYYTLKTNVNNLRLSVGANFRLPELSGHNDQKIDNPEEQLGHALYDNLNKDSRYLITEAHTNEQRSLLGLTTAPLTTSPRLLSTSQHIAGVHSTYAYVSSKSSFTAFHKEDCGLQSKNLHHGGAPKVWLIVNPRHTEQLEARIAQFDKKPPKCSQFVRHKNIIIPPKMLRTWDISFELVVQYKGTMITTDYNTYHYVWNVGANIAEAINVCEGQWFPPPLYSFCVRGRHCGSGPFLQASDMRIGKCRRLAIDSIHNAAKDSEKSITDSEDSALSVREEEGGGEQEEEEEEEGEEVEEEEVEEEDVEGEEVEEKEDDGDEAIEVREHCDAILNQTSHQQIKSQQALREHGIPVPFIGKVVTVTQRDNGPTFRKTELGGTFIPTPQTMDLEIKQCMEYSHRSKSSPPNPRPSVSPISEIDLTLLPDSPPDSARDLRPIDLDHALNDALSSSERLEMLIKEVLRYDHLISADAVRRFQYPKRHADQDSWLADTTVVMIVQNLLHIYQRDSIDMLEYSEFFSEGVGPREERQLIIPMLMGQHFFLVLLDKMDQKCYCYHKCSSNLQKRLYDAAQAIYPDISWSFEHRPNHTENQSSSDCAFILLADVERVLEPSLDLPSNPIDLRCRYLQIFTRGVREQVYSQTNGISLLKRKFECDVMGSNKIRIPAQGCDVPRVICLETSLQRFAHAEIYAQICMLRRRGQMILSQDDVDSTVCTAITLSTLGDLDVLLGSWKRDYGCIMLARHWNTRRAEIEVWRKRNNQRARKAATQATVTSRRSPVHIDKYISYTMQLEWRNEGCVNVSQACRHLQEAAGALDTESVARAAFLTSLVERGRKISQFIETFNDKFDALETPIWLLFSADAATWCYNADMADQQKFWHTLKRERTALCNSLGLISRGLRVVLGLADRSQLAIDSMEPEELNQQPLDSHSLLTCMQVVQQ